MEHALRWGLLALVILALEYLGIGLTRGRIFGGRSLWTAYPL